MAWKLDFDPSAEKEFGKLDKGIARGVKKYLLEVCQLEDPAERGHALTGPWAGFHRYKLGQVRVIVKIQRAAIVVMVMKIGRRDSVY